MNALLLCLYAQDAHQYLSVHSARFVSELAHKFGMQDTLRMCDDFLALDIYTDALWVSYPFPKPYYLVQTFLQHAVHPSVLADLIDLAVR